MIGSSIFGFDRRLTFAAGLIVALAGAGCKREEITSYRVPKEAAEPAMASAPMHGGMPDAAKPGISWDLPAGWVAKEGSQMRAGSFALPGGDGEVAVIPLPMGANVAAETVNMWRGEMGLSPIAGEDVSKEAKALRIAGVEGRSLIATSRTNTSVMAWLEQAGTLWMFKMSGATASVESQKEAFSRFLESVSFKKSAAMAVAAPRGVPMPAMGGPAAGGGSAHSEWKLPEGWRSAAPGPMVMASYKVGAEGGPGADVSVSMFPGDVGGTLANVNRWRGQLGLEALTADGLATATAAVDVGGEPGIMVDFNGTNARTGKPARMAGLIVPRDGNTWFYKLLGDAAVVGAEKPKLLEFAKIAH